MVKRKFNIYIVMIIIMLFTSFSVVNADELLTQEEVDKVSSMLTFSDGYGYLAFSNGVHNESASAMSSINDEVITELASQGL